MKTFFEIPKSKPDTPLLDKVNYPSDLKNFSKKELRQLSDELREFLIYSVSKSCLLYTSPSPRDVEESRMPSSA